MINLYGGAKSGEKENPRIYFDLSNQEKNIFRCNFTSFSLFMGQIHSTFRLKEKSLS